MSAPNLNSEDVKKILNHIDIKKIGEPLRGGQKLVLPIETSKNVYFAKFVEAPNPSEINDLVDNTALERLKREVGILKECNCDNLVKLAPYKFGNIRYNDKQLFYYIENVINGTDLSVLLNQSYKFSTEEIINLGLCINNAISALWQHNIIHRDIKPQNIIYDKTNKKFVLIDPGVAFDLNDISFTQPGCIVGTACFMSPEQLKPSERRNLTFRSDHFLLGICMYQLATNTHPFFMNAETVRDVHINIIKNRQIPAMEINKNVPEKLSLIIDRLLSKAAHFRYRNCKLLETELLELKKELFIKEKECQF